MKNLLSLAFCGLLSLPIFAQHPTSGLVARFTFDNDLRNEIDTTQIFAESQSRSFEQITDRDGNTATALDNSARSYRCRVPNLPIGYGDRSWSIWVNLKGKTNDNTSILNQGYSCFITRETNTILFGDQNNYRTTSLTVDSAWHHAAVVFNSNDLYIRFYWDGQLTDSIMFSAVQDTGRTVRLGISPFALEYTDYYADDLLLYNRMLTLSEVQSLAGYVPSSVRLSNLPIALPIYPNPARESFRLGLAANDQPLDVELLDLQGKRVGFYPNVQPNAELSTRELPNGVYLVRASDGRSQFSQKLVIQR